MSGKYANLYLEEGIKKVDVELFLKGHEETNNFDIKTAYFAMKPMLIKHPKMGLFSQSLDKGSECTSDAKLYREIQRILGVEDVLNYFSGNSTFFDYEVSNTILRQFMSNSADLDGRIKGEPSEVIITRFGKNLHELYKMKEVYNTAEVQRYAIPGGAKSCLKL